MAKLSDQARAAALKYIMDNLANTEPKDSSLDSMQTQQSQPSVRKLNLPPMDVSDPEAVLQIGQPKVMKVTDNDGFETKYPGYKKLRDSLSSQKGSDADVLDPAKRKKRKQDEYAEED